MATWCMSRTRAARTTRASGSHRAGRLRPLANSTVTVPSGSALGDVLFNSTGTKLVGTEVTSSEIDSFTVGCGRTPAERPGFAGRRQGLGQLGAEFNPANPSQLFISNAHNGTGLGTVSSYDVGFDGSLNPVSESRSPTARPRRAGSRSATTASTCSRQHRLEEHLLLRDRCRSGN